jgi:filamentous hemagglutinin
LINRNASLEQQARQAFALRNQYRTQARELMSDRNAAASLYKTDPNLTWEQIVQRQKDKGLTGDDIYKGIIASSQKSRQSVNESLGLK